MKWKDFFVTVAMSFQCFFSLACYVNHFSYLYVKFIVQQLTYISIYVAAKPLSIVHRIVSNLNVSFR